MKGQALVWFREYADSCQCSENVPPSPFSSLLELARLDPSLHVHSLPYRHNKGGLWVVCRSWASELKMVYELWVELGWQPRVSVVFPVERASRSWSLLSPPLHPGEWERYGEPTLEQSLAITVAHHRLFIWSEFLQRRVNTTERAFAELDMELSKPASPSVTASTLDLTGYGRP